MVAERIPEAPAPSGASPLEPDEDDVAILDAYSAAVSSVAEALIPSVASLRVTRQVGGWTAGGAGSAVAIVTSLVNTRLMRSRSWPERSIATWS